MRVNGLHMGGVLKVPEAFHVAPVGGGLSGGSGGSGARRVPNRASVFAHCLAGSSLSRTVGKLFVILRGFFAIRSSARVPSSRERHLQVCLAFSCPVRDVLIFIFSITTNCPEIS